MEFIIRNYFISDPGHILVWQDADQQEYRMLAHYSNDTSFMDLVHKGYDIHTGTASLIFNKPYEEVQSDERDKGKTGNFAIVYGIGGAGFAKALGYSINEEILKPGTKMLYKVFQAWKLPPYSQNITLDAALAVIGPMCEGMEEKEKWKVINGVKYFYDPTVQEGLKAASDFKKKYFAKFPDIKAFTKQCSDTASKRGYIKYWTNRRRHFKNPKEDGYKAPNSLIQGGCGEVIKKKMAEVRYFLKEGNYATKMVNNVHDELTTLHPISKRELEIIPEINKILCDLPFRVPISWGIDWGYRWGDKKPFTTLDGLYKELGV